MEQDKMNKSAMLIQVAAVALLAALSIGLWRISSDLKSVTDQVTQQSMLINRVLGKVLPYSLPAEVDVQIKAIQDRLTSESRAPTSQAAIEQLRTDLASVGGKLPPWAQEELLPRLVPMRWDIEALWLLASQPSDGLDQLSAYALTIDSLLSSKPIGSSDEIERRLTTRAQETEDTITKAERDNAVHQAERAIDDQKDIETAARLVSVYDDPKAKEITAKLNHIILARSIGDALRGVQDDFRKYQSIQDATLKEYALVRLSDATMDLQLRMLSAAPIDPQLEKTVTTLRNTVAAGVASTRQSRQSLLQAYQVWALKRIKQLPLYEEIEATEMAKIANQLDRNNPFSQANLGAKQKAQQILQTDMVRLLAPIDQGLLDLAVSDWFRKVYQQRFETLTDDAAKLAVVTGFSMTPKTSVESLQ
jgi:hypothetical protein